MRIVLWVAFWVFLLDQATKYLVVHMLDLRRLGAIEVWPPFLNLRMAWNTGINFGILADHGAVTRWGLIGVALLISADFLNMSCCGIDNPFAFNIADVTIFAGAFGMVLLPGGKKPS
jgi:signal peptidase II